MNGRVAGWSYQIGSWKEKSLVPSMADLKAEEPAKPSPTSSRTPGAAAASPAAPDSGASDAGNK
jgi:hypothetical protein